MFGWLKSRSGRRRISIITSVLGSSQSVAMILRRSVEFFYWLSLITIFLSGCSSIEKHQRGANKFSARSLLKSWRRKAQEQSARLFDRLPQNPEVFYTPVRKKNTLKMCFDSYRIIDYSRKSSGTGATQSRFITSRQMTGTYNFSDLSLSGWVQFVLTFNRYILEIHRIPAQSSGGPKKAVFLQHGVIESSGTWLVNPSSRSLRKYSKINLVTSMGVFNWVDPTFHSILIGW